MSAGLEVSAPAIVPLVDLAAQQAEVHDVVMAELAGVFTTAAFVGGTAVADFESGYARFTGARHCVGVANGTEALELALRAGGVGPGGEVILPANTFIATAEAVSRIGAVPVPVDVDARYLLMDPSAAAAAVTGRTQAIVPVHLFGQTAFVEQLLPVAASCGAVIIEDAAQAQGATRFGRSAGTLGLAAGTSFYPGKNLGAAGDAGGVLTNDPDVAAHVRLLGAHGSSVKYRHDVVGINSRLDTVQAVVLKAKLARLQEWNLLRRAAAERYACLLADIPGVELPAEAPGNTDVWHLYVVRVPDRDTLLAGLLARGIQAGIHYPVPVHLSGAYAGDGRGPGSFPVAEEAAGRILSLPLFPHITPDQQERVADALKAVRSSL
ncbi:erythromycin biosynthesis sensory transduction protein eryC1 [Arthrobacter sp. ZBG10]|uniref:DegT/DnrJ/EryC1/StrS family aminotransferase n=1 Tax=Arthrobacter sp. ZBG10 TaxID=1676590 RepID=UPI0006816C4A|nr:DegT/DnrJ/EryC1/StrS family aminotransferase [Arthrobacter sp. ZBG10]KNH22252.1 erythromycin biosynthesis sensory transduction protein eryC1 [Arthrobacter sp. ZBG10]